MLLSSLHPRRRKFAGELLAGVQILAELLAGVDVVEPAELLGFRIPSTGREAEGQGDGTENGLFHVFLPEKTRLIYIVCGICQYTKKPALSGRFQLVQIWRSLILCTEHTFCAQKTPLQSPFGHDGKANLALEPRIIHSDGKAIPALRKID